MVKYTLYVGLNDKDTKTQVLDSVECYKIAENIIVNDFGGCTIYNAKGIYTHNDGSVVIENTLRIEIIADDNDGAIINTCNALKVAFNQECIIVDKTTSNSIFV